ncbi:hypothetical protein KEM54_000443, partial [Ascosphaera aggregata]
SQPHGSVNAEWTPRQSAQTIPIVAIRILDSYCINHQYLPLPRTARLRPVWQTQKSWCFVIDTLIALLQQHLIDVVSGAHLACYARSTQLGASVKVRPPFLTHASCVMVALLLSMQIDNLFDINSAPSLDVSGGVAVLLRARLFDAH